MPFSVEDYKDVGPRYKHDCTNCQFVSRRWDDDIYICDKGHILEVVIRYGSRGPEYWTGTVFKKKEPRYYVKEVVIGGSYPLEAHWRVIDTLKNNRIVCTGVEEEKLRIIADMLNTKGEQHG